MPEGRNPGEQEDVPCIGNLLNHRGRDEYFNVLTAGAQKS